LLRLLCVVGDQGAQREAWGLKIYVFGVSRDLQSTPSHSLGSVTLERRERRHHYFSIGRREAT
jgi:hypothetical protein